MNELVAIEDGAIVIRVTADALKFATEHGCLCTFNPRTNLFRGVAVTDLEKWRAAIVRALRREDSTGGTPVNKMLDEALEWAVEQGEEGVSIEGILP